MERSKDDWLYGTETRPQILLQVLVESRTDSTHLSEVLLMRKLKKIATFFQEPLDNTFLMCYNIYVNKRNEGNEMELFCIMLVVCIIPMLGFVALGIYSDTKERRYVLYGGREFNCYCTSEFSGHMCCISIYEIMPNRKLFKEKYRAYKTFWISDYPTIKEGLYAMIEDYIQDEIEENKINSKWKELDNGN